MNAKHLLLVAISACLFLSACSNRRNKQMNLTLWDRGIKISSPKDEATFAYLWFYEWTMFDAVRKGEHKSGTSDWTWSLETVKKFAEKFICLMERRKIF